MKKKQKKMQKNKSATPRVRDSWESLERLRVWKIEESELKREMEGGKGDTRE